MHAVVNHLPIKPDADWAEMAAKFEAFAAGVRKDHPRLLTALLTKVSDAEAIFIGLYDDEETMKHVSSNVAAPWFADNIRPYLSGPVSRSAAAVIAGFVGG
jgi:hypothetical protein